MVSFMSDFQNDPGGIALDLQEGFREGRADAPVAAGAAVPLAMRYSVEAAASNHHSRGLSSSPVRVSNNMW